MSPGLLNSISLILFATGTPVGRGGRGRPQNEQSGLFFLSLSTIAERFMSVPVRRITIPIAPVFLFRILFYSVRFPADP